MALGIFNRIGAVEASDVSAELGALARFRDQPADVGVIALAVGLADSPAQVRKLA